MNEQIITTGNLAALDSAVDAVEQPKMILVSKWWLDFRQADKRKRGRMIRKRRKQRAMGLPINDGNLSPFESLKGK